MTKRLSWFKMYGAIRGTLEIIPPEKIGDALLSALQFFAEGQADEENMDTETRLAYRTIKQGILDSQTEYETRREAGKKAMEKRWKAAKNKG